MSDNYARDRLIPALLDRLTDDRPTETTEAPEQRVVSKGRLRELVLRDLNWLFNAQSAFGSDELAGIPEHVQSSTLNYGMPPLSGRLVSKIELPDLERVLAKAIQRFEPRLIPHTVRVRGIPPVDPLGHHNELSFEISADLWSQPYPIELLLKTDLDLETGLVELSEKSGAAIGSVRASAPAARR